jgi:hypothetical protein
MTARRATQPWWILTAVALIATLTVGCSSGEADTAKDDTAKDDTERVRNVGVEVGTLPEFDGTTLKWTGGTETLRSGEPNSVSVPNVDGRMTMAGLADDSGTLVALALLTPDQPTDVDWRSTAIALIAQHPSVLTSNTSGLLTLSLALTASEPYLALLEMLRLNAGTPLDGIAGLTEAVEAVVADMESVVASDPTDPSSRPGGRGRSVASRIDAGDTCVEGSRIFPGPQFDYPPGDEPIVHLGADLGDGMCVTEPTVSTERSSATARFRQFGLRHTYVLDETGRKVLGIIPMREIGVDGLGDLVVEYIEALGDEAADFLSGIGNCALSLFTANGFDGCEDEPTLEERLGDVLANTFTDPAFTEEVTVGVNPAGTGTARGALVGMVAEESTPEIAEQYILVVLSSFVAWLDLVASPAADLLGISSNCAAGAFRDSVLEDVDMTNSLLALARTDPPTLSVEGVSDLVERWVPNAYRSCVESFASDLVELGVEEVLTALIGGVAGVAMKVWEVAWAVGQAKGKGDELLRDTSLPYCTSFALFADAASAAAADDRGGTDPCTGNPLADRCSRPSLSPSELVDCQVPISEGELQNMTLPEDSCAAPLNSLSEGRASGSANGGFLTVQLVSPVVTDVDADGRADGVAGVFCEFVLDGAAKEGHVAELYLVRAAEHIPIRVPGVLEPLPGAESNPFIDGVTADGARIAVTATAHTPSDPPGAPTLDVLSTLSYDGTNLKVVEQTTTGVDAVTDQFVDALNRDDRQSIAGQTSDEASEYFGSPTVEPGGRWVREGGACDGARCAVTYISPEGGGAAYVLLWSHPGYADWEVSSIESLGGGE